MKNLKEQIADTPPRWAYQTSPHAVYCAAGTMYNVLNDGGVMESLSIIKDECEES